MKSQPPEQKEKENGDPRETRPRPENKFPLGWPLPETAGQALCVAPVLHRMALSPESLRPDRGQVLPAGDPTYPTTEIIMAATTR